MSQPLKRITREQAIALLRSADENGKNKESDYRHDFREIRRGAYVLAEMALCDLDYISQNPDRELFYAAVPGPFPPVLAIFSERMFRFREADGRPLTAAVTNGNHRCCASELRGSVTITSIMQEEQYELFQRTKGLKAFSLAA